MKRYIRLIYSFFVLIVIIGMVLSSCKKETSVGVPSIRYVRITDPTKSDSLLAGAYLGNMINIIGDNLGSVREIWFNDQKAYLNPTLVTNQSILVTVPDSIPIVVTDKMKLVYSSTDTLSLDFKAIVPAPTVTSMTCEYVNDGDVASIQGDFFINNSNTPLQVIFPGNIPGTIQSFSKKSISVVVPTGSGPGPITVKSLYGSTLSKFYFRDNRNIFLDFDSKVITGSWQNGVYASTNPAGISGNYDRLAGGTRDAGGQPWDEVDFSFHFWPSPMGLPNTPLYSGDLSKAALKFECNVYQTWSSGALEIMFVPYSVFYNNSYIAGDKNTPRALWMPWKNSGSYITNGWTTVTIPLTDFIYVYDGTVCMTKLTQDMLYGCTFYLWNGGVSGKACSPGLAVDNLRIVPIQ